MLRPHVCSIAFDNESRFINLLDLEEDDLNFDSQINGKRRWTLEEGQIRQLSSDEVMLPFLEFIDENVVGGKTRFGGPYGQRRGMILSVKEWPLCC